MKYTCLILSLLVIVCQNGISRDNENLFYEYKKKYYLQCDDSLYVYKFITESKSVILAEIDKNYTWFYNNAIHNSYGNYSGKLLNGEYTKFKKGTYNLVEKGNYLHGTKNGSWYYWHEDGTLSSYIEYENGIKNGTYIQYADSNKYAIKGTYKNNLKENQWTSYQDGLVINLTTYKKGIKNGKSITYDKNGNISKVEKYRNGLLNGKCYVYKDNKIISSEIYKKGKLKEKKNLRKLIKKIFINKEDSKSSSFSETNNGKRLKEKSKKQDKR
ncbi:MAG: hypothetical protein IJY54_00740 [Paludibacteraceae bacterium]|nr:hypothetical protein [Paludibacteraceae bacterium]